MRKVTYRGRHLVNPAGRIEMTADVTDETGATTAFQLAPRRLTILASEPWSQYHRGDKVTIEQNLAGRQWLFHGIVLHKRLNKLVLGEAPGA